MMKPKKHNGVGYAFASRGTARVQQPMPKRGAVMPGVGRADKSAVQKGSGMGNGHATGMGSTQSRIAGWG